VALSLSAHPPSYPPQTVCVCVNPVLRGISFLSAVGQSEVLSQVADPTDPRMF